MKITKRQLKRIIKEEQQKLLHVAPSKTGRATKLRITERRLRQEIHSAIKSRNLRRLIEQAADQQKIPPTEASIDKAVAAIEQGANEAQNEFKPKVIIDGMKEAVAKLGFTDPCEYVAKERKAVEAELAGMEQAAAALRYSNNPVEGLEGFIEVLKTLAMGSGLAALFSWGSYQVALKSSVGTLGKNLVSLKAAGAVEGAAASGWFSWLPGAAKVGTKAAEVAATAAADTAAIEAAAASSATVLGLNAAAWLTIGKVLAAIAIAIWIYKWMLKSGAACTMKNFIAGVAGVIADGAKWAYKSVVKPFADKVLDWGGGLVDIVKGWFKKESIERKRLVRNHSRSGSRQLLETRRRHQYARSQVIAEWRRFNEAALTLHLGCLV